VPARTARDLLGLAKSRPQPLQYGSAGSGSISHMATELLSYTSGMRFQINRGLQSPAIKDILAQQGADPLQGSVDQYAAFVRNELAKWTKVVAAAGLKVE